MKLFSHSRPESFRIGVRLSAQAFEFCVRLDVRLRGKFRRRREDSVFVEH
jgi:hypothetical protein